MEKIKSLSGSVHSTLRASVFLFDITRVVEELVFNSLDAGATKVDVGVNIEECFLKVEDNGFGFTREGLALLGERYATSKISKSFGVDDCTGELGSRGEALSSLSDISLLEVVTKARGRPNAYRKIMKGRNCLFIGIEDSRQTVGTTVIVRDLFYNQPVKRRSMLSSPKKILLSVKKCMLHTALVHPTISFNLIDLECETEVFHTVPSSSPLALVSSYFGGEVSSFLHEVNYLDKNMKLYGFLSSPHGPGLMKAFQYLYINSRLVCRGPIHKLINNLASGVSSSLKYSSGPELRDMKRQRMQDCPAYLLNLHCPVSSYDLTYEPSKTIVEFKDWSIVLSFIEEAVWSSWKENIDPSISGNVSKPDCGLCMGNKIDDGDVFATSANFDKKRKVTFDWSTYEATNELKFLKTDNDYDFHADFAYDKNTKSSEVSLDELDFLEDNKLDMRKPNNALFVMTPTRWDEEDYKGKRTDFPFLQSTPNFNGNKRDTWNVPFLTRCGQSLDMCGNDHLLQEDRSDVDEEFSDQLDDMFQERDQFTFSFSSVGGGVEKRKLEEVSKHYCDMENLESAKGTRGYGSPISFDDLDWCLGRRDTKHFDSEFGNFQAVSTLEFNGNEDSWFNTARIQSRNDKNFKCERFSKIAKESENLGTSLLKRRNRTRSRSAPPFYESKSKISFRGPYDALKCKNVCARSSKGAADLLVNASQPCGAVQMVANKKESGTKFDGIKSHRTLVEVQAANADDFDFLDSNTKWRTCDLPMHSSVQENRAPKFPVYDDILDISSGMLHMTGNSLVPESICRKTLQDARVLQQLDKKFIPATAGEVLIVIDQHAADERIRLEELRKKVMSGEGCSITYLDSEHELVLPEIGLQMVQNYSEQIRKWGWICSSNAQFSGSLSRNLSLLKKKSCSMSISAVPCVLGIDLSEKDLMEYLEQLADTDGASSMPPSVLRILNFKSCRGAIMFGDPLLPSECSLIVEELKGTSLCFQCAHGRPTTAPLVNLAELRRQLAKLNPQAGGKIATWHGLQQHSPSMVRARARLSSSKR